MQQQQQQPYSYDTVVRNSRPNTGVNVSAQLNGDDKRIFISSSTSHEEGTRAQQEVQDERKTMQHPKR